MTQARADTAVGTQMVLCVNGYSETMDINAITQLKMLDTMLMTEVREPILAELP